MPLCQGLPALGLGALSSGSRPDSKAGSLPGEEDNDEDSDDEQESCSSENLGCSVLGVGIQV